MLFICVTLRLPGSSKFTSAKLRCGSHPEKVEFWLPAEFSHLGNKFEEREVTFFEWSHFHFVYNQGEMSWLTILTAAFQLVTKEMSFFPRRSACSNFIACI